jgi:hypothetical protein
VKRKARVGDEANPQLDLFKDMFIAFLLLQGVPQGNVARIVQVATLRVNSIGKNVRVKGS